MYRPGSFLRDWVEKDHLAPLYNLRLGHVPRLIMIGDKFMWSCSCGAKGRKLVDSQYQVDYGWWKHFQTKMHKLWALVEYP